ncbi:hypothetical protein HNQ41_002301 [Texcoconibacillus texcoconensis]|uniref:Uncharacterized protein n=1 Tax=Texcoconibacillus texcoconensis TaxID=1095777 RepID=A0A840QS50_9BACI|nr:hypothetical protein [Texcoconibacillus texcoconensis]
MRNSKSIDQGWHSQFIYVLMKVAMKEDAQ